MKATMKSFKMLVTQVSKDGILLVVLFAPILMGLLFKLGVPLGERIIASNLGKEDFFKDYYVLFDLMLAVMTPYMFCFVASMTMLDEFDNNIINHLAITPIRKKGYLISRLIFPSIIAALASLIILLIFSLSKWSFAMMIIICLLTSLMSISVSLIVFSYSHNKVEGMAIAKLSGLVIIGMFIPYSIDNNIQYVFSILPSFWIAKFKMEPGIIFFLLSMISSIIWIIVLYKRFIKKLSS